MKLKIKIKASSPECMPEITPQGDWIDLKSAEEFVNIPAGSVGDNTVYFSSKLISVGVAMQLPKGFEAIIAPRSSLFKKKGALLTNSIGVIDNVYCGEDDIWKVQFVALKPCIISKYERIAQFRIQLSQKATLWQKLKWLLCNGVELVPVKELKQKNRGGFGSTNGYK